MAAFGAGEGEKTPRFTAFQNFFSFYPTFFQKLVSILRGGMRNAKKTDLAYKPS
jgi:hypothetical protein